MAWSFLNIFGKQKPMVTIPTEQERQGFFNRDRTGHQNRVLNELKERDSVQRELEIKNGFKRLGLDVLNNLVNPIGSSIGRIVERIRGTDPTTRFMKRNYNRGWNLEKILKAVLPFDSTRKWLDSGRSDENVVKNQINLNLQKEWSDRRNSAKELLDTWSYRRRAKIGGSPTERRRTIFREMQIANTRVNDKGKFVAIDPNRPSLVDTHPNLDYGQIPKVVREKNFMQPPDKEHTRD